jgi:hypothetical protein
LFADAYLHDVSPEIRCEFVSGEVNGSFALVVRYDLSAMLGRDPLQMIVIYEKIV